MTLLFLCFLTVGVLARTEPHCADGTCEDLGASKQVDDESTDMRVELLQRDLKLSSRDKKLDHAKDGTAEVEEWNCKGSETAYQSTTAGDNSWTRMKVLNLATGGYGLVYDVDLNKFADVDDCPRQGKRCKIRSMNACAIHQKKVKGKGVLYCAIQIYDKGAFLVALDQKNNFGFVLPLLGWRYAATFYKDDYYVSGDQGLSIIKNVPNLPKFKSWVEMNSHYYGRGLQAGELKVPLKMGGYSSYNFGFGADFVIWQNKKEKPADDYLMTLKDRELLLIQLSKGGKDILDHGEKEVISMKTNVEVGPNGKRCWGAGWNFNGAIFFSADDGYGGVWRFEDASFKTNEANFTNVSAANQIDWNDGFTCGYSLTKKNNPLSCEHDFYQVITEMNIVNDKTVGGPWSDSPQTKTYSQTIVRHLDPVSGTFKQDFVVNRQRFPKMTSLNACAVHPTTNKLYCIMALTDFQAIAAVDETGPALVMKHVPANGGSSMCFAAIFDPDGNYWYWCNDDYLYKAEKLEGKKFLLAETDNDFAETDTTAYGPEFTADKLGADFVIWKKGKNTYLISIVESENNDVSVIDITDQKPSKPEVFKSEGLKDAGQNGKKTTWGSSWTAPAGGKYEGKAFFTPDVTEKQEAKSLYELTKVDFEEKKAYFTIGGKAAKATWHDGFTCKTKIASINKDRKAVDSR